MSSLFDIESEHFTREVKVIIPKSYPDSRGTFVLTHLDNEFEAMGLPKFKRHMYTRSKQGVLRGLHFQDPPMGKLLQVMSGAAFLAVVDIRPLAPNHFTIILSSRNNRQVWVPGGFAVGYYALTPDMIMHYSTDCYLGTDRVIRWDDPDIGIDWPFDDEPTLSERDAHAPTWREL